ncbi:MAG: insulinase family protein [Prevotellaceae bacterium]|jgi:predicted Zn-dependent peptidase|nr:insulinase family protein [Prevotellaceae bacterium]
MKKIFCILTFLFCVALLSAQTVDRSIRPSAAPAKEINIKDADTFTLDNGLKVFVVEDHRAPIVYYSLRLDIKPALEGEKAGLQELFDGVVGTATQTLVKEQLNKEIDMIGAKINLSSRGGSGSGLKKYESRMLELLADMILNPSFTEDELELNRKQLKSGLQYIQDDPASISERLTSALRYGKGFPDGELVTQVTADNVTVADLETFYGTYFAPNVTRLVVVGDITPAEAKEASQKYFGAWEKREVPVATYTLPKAPDHSLVAMFHKEGAVQSVVGLTYPIDFKPGASDATEAIVANVILGGGMSGRLFTNLRETHSYTYGAYSSLKDGELVGSFAITSGRSSGASVKAAATDSSITQIIFEMNRMANTSVSIDDLKSAKAYLAGSFGRSLQNSSTIANFAVNIDKFNLPKDYYKNYLTRLDAVTLADVQAVSGKYFTPKNAWIIVVGDKQYAENVKQFAANQTVQFYDINANPVAAPETKSAEISAEQILNNYVNALGGAKTLEAIVDYKLTATMSTMGQNFEMIQMFKAPHYSLQSVGMGGMVLQKYVFDGTTLKVSGMQGNAEFTEGDDFEETKAGASICAEMNYIKNGFVLTVGGIEEVNGNEAYVITVKKGEKVVTEYYDVETGLKVKTTAILNHPQAGEIQQITEYVDYREVNGVMFPYLTKQRVATMETVITISEILVNSGLSVDDFN